MKYLLMLALVLWHPLAFSWADHGGLARVALQDVDALKQKTLVYRPVEDLFSALGYASQIAFNESLKIKKNFVFKADLNEISGKGIPLIDVVSHYADEPDWDMDLELFDEYPEVWKPEFAMMGGRTGKSSQSFRHMYWPPLQLLNPLVTFKVPLTKLTVGMGEAPERAALFIELAHRAKAAGQPYWEARFVADALHYLQDITNPYHCTQTATKKFLPISVKKNFTPSGIKNYVAEMTQVISYYHLGFEDTVGKAVMTDMGQSWRTALSAQGGVWTERLGGEGNYNGQNMADFLKKVVNLALPFAHETGSTSINFFPDITVPMEDFKASVYMDEEWWKQVMTRLQAPTVEKAAFVDNVANLLALYGAVTRQVVLTELVK